MANEEELLRTNIISKSPERTSSTSERPNADPTRLQPPLHWGSFIFDIESNRYIDTVTNQVQSAAFTSIVLQEVAKNINRLEENQAKFPHKSRVDLLNTCLVRLIYPTTLLMKTSTKKTETDNK